MRDSRSHAVLQSRRRRTLCRGWFLSGIDRVALSQQSCDLDKRLNSLGAAHPRRGELATSVLVHCAPVGAVRAGGSGARRVSSFSDQLAVLRRLGRRSAQIRPGSSTRPRGQPAADTGLSPARCSPNSDVGRRQSSLGGVLAQRRLADPGERGDVGVAQERRAIGRCTARLAFAHRLIVPHRRRVRARVIHSASPPYRDKW